LNMDVNLIIVQGPTFFDYKAFYLTIMEFQ